jgi:uncharacterized membrane protein/nitrite reductase/ring-hydroxylating ferredoxin subunit
MRSRAHFKTHPIHPMLIAFPLAFFVGTFIFDLLGFLMAQKSSMLIVAYYLNIAGVIAAVLAAIPGIMDFLHSVPPKSSAKDRAAKHGVVNSVATIIFLVSFVFRNMEAPDFVTILLIEVVGLVLLTIGGWMGGTLVYRNSIGVFPRYASAGKWSEEYFDSEGKEKIDVGKTDDLHTDQMKLLHVDGKRIVLGKTETGFVAFSDRCTHKGASLASGVLICGTVQCPWHGSQFDVKTGVVKAGPAKEAIQYYQVEVSGSRFYLTLGST